jgi:hypothetical protein
VVITVVLEAPVVALVVITAALEVQGALEDLEVPLVVLAAITVMALVVQ